MLCLRFDTEYDLLSTWRDGSGVIVVIIYLSVAFALHLIIYSFIAIRSYVTAC